MNNTAEAMDNQNIETQPVVTQDAEPTTQDVTEKVIEVANPTTEEMAGLVKHIDVNYDFKVQTQSVAFNFKKSKDKDTGIQTIRKTVELAIPYPSIEGIVAILEAGDKGLELLQEAVANVVNTAAREILYEDTKGELNAANFPIERVSWDAISKIPKAQRRGGGIPKDVWDAFAIDYIAVMPEAAGKTIDQVSRAAKIFVGKLVHVRSKEEVLQHLLIQLAIYADKAPNIEEFAECVSFLVNKAETFLNVSDDELLAAL